MGSYPIYKSSIRYNESGNSCELHTLDVCIPRPITADDRVWMIYIHGGAWRDPEIDSTSSHAYTELLLRERIAGFASLNYRLSPYPSHPTSPSNPDDPSRNAKHPDHIDDIVAGLAFLQEQYRFGDRYILVGHSCGATLALQILLHPKLPFSKPKAVVGVAGIYDLKAFAQDSTYCKDIVINAFGPDKNVWNEASPINGHFRELWPTGTIIAIAMSLQDELLGPKQSEDMVDALQKDLVDGPKVVKVVIEGKHDEIWNEGTNLVRAIRPALEALGIVS